MPKHQEVAMEQIELCCTVCAIANERQQRRIFLSICSLFAGAFNQALYYKLIWDLDASKHQALIIKYPALKCLLK